MSGVRSVHPRSRAEHLMTSDVPGGPPRFIPARAGNTRPPPASSSGSTVHPRSRGEHPIVSVTEEGHNGSSPLARGTRLWGAHAIAIERFIPARAGNTCLHLPGRTLPPVHPRSRGEHRLSLAHCRHSRRFIPARAGNTISPDSAGGSSPVHPRSRGEHQMKAYFHTILSGSSPLARGTLSGYFVVMPPPRFIPARAGNTHGPREPEDDAPVHPRSRGEHVGRRGVRPSGGRFIPARAGNTLPGFDVPADLPVHPRSRGEHLARKQVVIRVSGSSPLARGTRSAHERGDRRGRFIPARAGNTYCSACTR